MSGHLINPHLRMEVEPPTGDDLRDVFNDFSIDDILEKEDLGMTLRYLFQNPSEAGNGYLDAAELRNALARNGEPLTAKELDELFQNADIDGDGKINYDEFAKITMKG